MANFKACIRTYGSSDEIVACEDISRGGLRFKSKKEYTANTEIEVAAPDIRREHTPFLCMRKSCTWWN